MEDKDTFETSLKYQHLEKQTSDNNFFINNESSKNFSIETSRHLNDYDSNLLEEDAYRNVSNELLKLEYKIEQIERNLRIIDKKISVTKNICDNEELCSLHEEKNKLLKDYEYYTNLYKEKSLSSKISINLTSIFKNKKKSSSVFGKIKNILSVMLKRILPCKVQNLIEVRNSIDTLNSINSTVDEIISQKDFSTNRFDKYNQLSQYIIKANELQNKISKNIKIR